MPFGGDCEFDTFEECERANADKRDPGAYCAELKERTEVEHCGGSPLAADPGDLVPGVRLPGQPKLAASAPRVLAARFEWEQAITGQADKAVAVFLNQVTSEALEALSAPVLLAALSNPFSRAAVRSAWERTAQRFAVLRELPLDLAADVYGAVSDAMASEPVTRLRSRIPSLLAYEHTDTGGPDWQGRVATSSRTLATRLFNQRRMEAMASAGYTRKRWAAHLDERARESHVLADEQTVKLYDAFVVGGSLLAYPGDPGGAPGDVINCRCVIVPA